MVARALHSHSARPQIGTARPQGAAGDIGCWELAARLPMGSIVHGGSRWQQTFGRFRITAHRLAWHGQQHRQAAGHRYSHRLHHIA
jgi:hypothetical protein